MKKINKFRTFYYIAGMIILALGITLNTKTGLGVSPIISVPYSISNIAHLNFGNITLIIYCIFVAVELLLKGKKSTILDFLQIPLSLIFTRFMNLFDAILPIQFTSPIANMILLLFAIVLTGIGAAMTLNMRLVPNPGDGIVQAISDFIHKSVGFTKNCFDLFNILITISLSLLFTRHLIGVGLGTVIAVIGVGRVIAAFNHFFKHAMIQKAELV